MASGEIRLSTMTMRRMPVLAQSQAPQVQTGSDGLQEIIVTGAPSAPPPGTPTPPDNIPNGPWEWNPNSQNPRRGNWMGPKQPRGGRWTATYSPPTPDQRGYWKSNGPDGSKQWFDEDGNPMTPDQKQWQPPDDSLPALPFAVPGTNPWWWFCLLYTSRCV